MIPWNRVTHCVAQLPTRNHASLTTYAPFFLDASSARPPAAIAADAYGLVNFQGAPACVLHKRNAQTARPWNSQLVQKVHELLTRALTDTLWFTLY
jgi:hypothetical protein